MKGKMFCGRNSDRLTVLVLKQLVDESISRLPEQLCSTLLLFD